MFGYFRDMMRSISVKDCCKLFPKVSCEFDAALVL